MQHAINWFEIPARDIDRAQAFYEKVLAKPMRRDSMGAHTMVMVPSDAEGVGGCLLAGDGEPAAAGTVVYLNAEPSIDALLARVPKAGGRVTTPKTALPEGMGWFAHIEDSEGNRVGVHALA